MPMKTPPDTATEANPLDGFPELAKAFEYLAHNARNVSLLKWQEFSDALYGALNEDRQQIADLRAQVEKLLGDAMDFGVESLLARAASERDPLRRHQACMRMEGWARHNYPDAWNALCARKAAAVMGEKL